MVMEINDLIRTCITDESHVRFMNFLLGYNPISFIKEDTREIINTHINPVNETQYKALNFVSTITAIIVSNETYYNYINKFIRIYLDSIKDMVGEFSVIFYTPNDVEVVLNKDNKIYMILLFILINYKNKPKIYKIQGNK